MSGGRELAGTFDIDGAAASEMLRRLGLAAEFVGDSIEFTDPDGRAQWVNPAFARLTGYTLSEAIGSTPTELLRSDAHPDLFYEQIWSQASSGGVWRGLITSRKKDGNLFTADCTLSSVLNNEGEISAYICVRRDVTQEHEKQLELGSALSRYALAAAGGNDGMWGWDLNTNEVLLSARWRDMLGHDAVEHRGSPSIWMDSVHVDDRDLVQAAVDAHLNGDTAHFECEYRVMHVDGGWRWMHCRGLVERDVTGRPMLLAGSQADITKRRVAERRLRHEALHDALTGLPNRALFEDRLQQALQRLRRFPKGQVAVLFIDLDRFKNINDGYGHAAGDELLRRVGQRLLRTVRGADSVARLGGDEFTILLDGIGGEQEVQEVVRRIQAALRLPIRFGATETAISASIGVTVAMSKHTTADEMLRDADTAMYQAKEAGRDRAVIFAPEMREAVVGRVEIEAALRSALARGEFALHYQPIVTLPGNRTTGYEALVRWNRPGEGIQAPGHFLPIAREAGLMPRLEGWVLNEACRQVARLRTPNSDIHVAVNVSPERVIGGGLVDEVREALEQYEIPPSALKLEITETSLLGDELAASEALGAIRSLGVGICLDDFGTGYSSLSYIHRFPVDVLKIDRSFVAGLDTGSGGQAIVAAIVGMSRGLGLSVVAEGVETAAQLKRVQELGCDYAQGYFLGRPAKLGE